MLLFFINIWDKWLLKTSTKTVITQIEMVIEKHVFTVHIKRQIKAIKRQSYFTNVFVFLSVTSKYKQTNVKHFDIIETNSLKMRIPADKFVKCC